MHKDYYDNLFVVLRGSKEFLMFPPSDAAFLKDCQVPAARFQPNSDTMAAPWRTVLDGKSPEEDISWIAVNPDVPSFSHYPLFKLATPVRVTVEPGDIFFLPAIWFHRVAQSGVCICANAWYDMKFGPAHAAMNASTAIGRLARALPLGEQIAIAEEVLRRDEDDASSAEDEGFACSGSSDKAID